MIQSVANITTSTGVSKWFIAKGSQDEYRSSLKQSQTLLSKPAEPTTRVVGFCISASDIEMN
jgi:hypothetical protein